MARCQTWIVSTDPAVRAAVRTLSGIFWSSSGWRVPRGRPAEDALDAAVRAGVMFRERRVLDHDGWVDTACAAVAQVTPIDVAAAFVTSLATRRLDLRSALGSYAVARHLTPHAFAAHRSSDRCAVCGLDRRPLPEDLNVPSTPRPPTWPPMSGA